MKVHLGEAVLVNVNKNAINDRSVKLKTKNTFMDVGILSLQ